MNDCRIIKLKYLIKLAKLKRLNSQISQITNLKKHDNRTKW